MRKFSEARNALLAHRGSVRTLLGYARPYRRILAVTLVLTLLASAGGLVQPLVAQSVLSALGTGQSVLGPILLLAVLLVISAALSGLNTWLQQRTSERVVRRVRRDVVYRLIRLRIPELDRRPPGDLAARVTSDSTLLQGAATDGLIMLINGALTFLAAISLMATLNVALFGVTMIVLVVIILVMTFVLPRIQYAVLQAQSSVGAIGAALDRTLGAARTVKANGAEARETALADDAIQGAYRAGLTGAKYSAINSTISASSIHVAFLVVLGFGGMLVATGELTVPTLIAFLLYVFYLSTPIMSLTNGAVMFYQGLGAIGRIEEVSDMEVETDVDAEPDGPVSSTAPTIEMRGVSFSYPGRAPALENVTFTVAGSTQTAVVGLSGAGKTTLFSLLQRFYEPQRGSILVDGVDISGLSRAEVRRRIAYVEQDTPALDGTFLDNLRYATEDASDEDVQRVLRLTKLDGLVRRLPEGLDTAVGPRGITLSGGERQRLAIARALLRKPQVLLLDEATAQLDARNEQALREAVASAATECTVILIAHRLSTVTDVDQIVVLEHGKVRASGTHCSLVDDDELYRELATSQLLAGEPRAAVS